MTPAEQQLLMPGLDEIESAAKAGHGASFVSVTTTAQDSVLRGGAISQEGRDESSFALIRSATVLGYFTSVPVGKNVLHYDPILGAYDGCIPTDLVGRRNWTT
jgi:Gluconate 2-dehydrogenase subunit 3